MAETSMHNLLETDVRLCARGHPGEPLKRAQRGLSACLGREGKEEGMRTRGEQ